MQSDHKCSLGSGAEPWWDFKGQNPKYFWLSNVFKTIKHLTMALKNYIHGLCYYHITHMFQSESTLYSCLNVKEVHAWNRRNVWSLSNSNKIQTQNQLVHKQTLNHLAKLTWFESCCCCVYSWLKKLYLLISNLFMLAHILTSGRVWYYIGKILTPSYLCSWSCWWRYMLTKHKKLTKSVISCLYRLKKHNLASICFFSFKIKQKDLIV